MRPADTTCPGRPAAARAVARLLHGGWCRALSCRRVRVPQVPLRASRGSSPHPAQLPAPRPPQLAATRDADGGGAPGGWATSPMAASRVGSRSRHSNPAAQRECRCYLRRSPILPASGPGSAASRVCATIADPDRMWRFVTGNRWPGGSRMAPGQSKKTASVSPLSPTTWPGPSAIERVLDAGIESPRPRQRGPAGAVPW